MSDVVLFEELICQNKKKIGVVTLNNPKSLNALSHEMVKLMTPALQEWQTNDDIAVILIQGQGEKAFCAGGDVVHLYNNLPNNDGDGAPIIEQFFTDEYELDYLIHTYQKPIIVWGNGIVMGGGLGLMAGASHRVATEYTKIAMPEITIGLYPDVGGSYFLNKMPGNCGLFLGLTGATINGTDAKYVSLADHFIAEQFKQQLLADLLAVNWGDTNALNEEKLDNALLVYEQQSKPVAPHSNIKPYQSLIDEVTRGNDLTAIVDNIISIDSDDKWLRKAKNALQHGSPLSAQITYRQLQRGKVLTLAECFQMELTLSTKCGRFGEFKEGVRALLIDKDNQPNWRFKDVSSVDSTVIDWFFTSDYNDQEHPLAYLQ